MMALGAALLILSAACAAVCWLYRQSYEDDD